MAIPVKIKEPIAPEKVLLGLIFVNLGPLNNFPKINPPISEAIHPNKIQKIKIFNCRKFEKQKKMKLNKKMYSEKRVLEIIKYNLFFIILFDMFKNSRSDKTLSIIKLKTSIELNLKIIKNNINKISDV